MKFTLDVKPLSVNDAWQPYCEKCRSIRAVKRQKSHKYQWYEKNVGFRLKPSKFDFSTDLKLKITFGFSSRNSDIDNPLKPLIDIMQKKYGFNDNQIFKLNVKKILTKPKKEFIRVEFQNIKP